LAVPWGASGRCVELFRQVSRLNNFDISALPSPEPANRAAHPLADDVTREFPAEGDHVEFKKGTGERPVRETAVAFSNAAGGVIVVGVDDARAIVGRALDSGTADAIHNALSNARDIDRYDVHALDVEGVAITAVSTAGAHAEVSGDGARRGAGDPSPGAWPRPVGEPPGIHRPPGPGASAIEAAIRAEG